MDALHLNVILADDDADDCFFFEDALKEAFTGVSFTCVNDGTKLMEFLNQSTTSLPDVLFLDLNMPRKNGFECLADLKADEKLKHIPVIIYSTSYDEETAARLFKSGAQHYIRKPGEFSKLKNVIVKALTIIAQVNPQNTGKADFVIYS